MYSRLMFNTSPNSNLSCEYVAKINMILITGEILTTSKINEEQIIKNHLKEIGYNDEKKE